MPVWLEITLKIIETTCILATAIMAFISINAWRKETIGRRKAELAEEVLSAFYEARDVFGWARFPGSFGGEGATRTPAKNETSEQTHSRNTWFVPIERLTKHADLFSKIQSLKYRFMAYFGESAEKPFKDMKLIHSKIVVAAGTLINMEPADRRMTSSRDSTKDLRERSEGAIGWFLDEDPLAPLIEEAITGIEGVCKQYLLDRKL